MARKKKEKYTIDNRAPVAFDLKYQNRPGPKWGMKVAVPRITKAVTVGASKAVPRDVAKEKAAHKLKRRKGKPPKGFKWKS